LLQFVPLLFAADAAAAAAVSSTYYVCDTYSWTHTQHATHIVVPAPAAAAAAGLLELRVQATSPATGTRGSSTSRSRVGSRRGGMRGGGGHALGGCHALGVGQTLTLSLFHRRQVALNLHRLKQLVNEECAQRCCRAHTSAYASIRRHTSSAYVSIRQQLVHRERAHRHAARALTCQYLYLCTSKASKLSTCTVDGAPSYLRYLRPHLRHLRARALIARA
jgi:hypothetical protein